MTQTQSLPAAAAYPAAPWALSGRMWAGVFRTAHDVQVPARTRQLFGKRRLAVVLLQYTGGTLRYDELIIGVPIRHRSRIGLWVRDIWVNDHAALWGGRDIWRVPKLLAEFVWSEDAVEIRDELGAVATIVLLPRRTWLPWAWFPVPMFGDLGGCWSYAVATWRGRLGGPGMLLRNVPDRFPEQPSNKPVFGIGSDRFRMIVHRPRGDAAED